MAKAVDGLVPKWKGFQEIGKVEEKNRIPPEEMNEANGEIDYPYI